jgi:large subunit ribosomal protein L19
VNVLDEIVSDQLRTDLPEIASGDTVKVSAKVIEGNRERIQVFEGIVMRLRGGGITRSITVRRIASGVGVERTFKIHSPRIEKIEVIRHGQVRRAQLYFLRDRVGKAATLGSAARAAEPASDAFPTPASAGVVRFPGVGPGPGCCRPHLRRGSRERRAREARPRAPQTTRPRTGYPDDP